MKEDGMYRQEGPGPWDRPLELSAGLLVLNDIILLGHFLTTWQAKKTNCKHSIESIPGVDIIHINMRNPSEDVFKNKRSYKKLF